VVQCMLELEVDVDEYDNDQCTPLWHAAKNGHIDVVTHLVERNADVFLTADNGYSPLDIAWEYGNTDVVEFLLEHGANDEMKDFFDKLSIS